MLVAETVEFDNVTLVSSSFGGRVSKITAVESRFVQTSLLCEFRGAWDKFTATRSTFSNLSAPQLHWLELHHCTMEKSTVDTKWAQFDTSRPSDPQLCHSVPCWELIICGRRIID